VDDDRWAAFLDDIVRAFEIGTFLTAFEVPGKVGRLPNALGGDPDRWSLIAAPAKGKKGLFELLQAKAHFLMLPKRIVAIMNTTRVRFLDAAPTEGADGDTQGQDYPRLAEIRILGAGDALAKAGWDLGRAGTAPDPHNTYNILDTLYHELTHAWLWLQEFFANLCTHAWVAERAPQDLSILSTLPRLAVKAPPATFAHTSRDEFERLYMDVGGPNYVWYQFRLQVEAGALYDRAGAGVVRRLFEAFRLDDEALARRLATDVDPGLAEFSLGF